MTEDLRTLVGQLGAQLGLDDLSPNREGVVLLGVDTFTCRIYQDEAANTVVMQTCLGTLPEDFADAGLYRALFAANSMGSGACGFSLGLSPGSNTVCLVGAVPCSGLTVAKLYSVIELFAHVAAVWEAKLYRVLNGGELEAAEPVMAPMQCRV